MDKTAFRFQLYKTSKTRFRQEGLNTLNYSVLITRPEPLYTWIQVLYNESQIMQVSWIYIFYIGSMYENADTQDENVGAYTRTFATSLPGSTSLT